MTTDSTVDRSTSDTDPASDDERATDRTGPNRREVVVPMRIYKAVTVFSTLFAMGAVVLGFVLLDAATNRATVDLSEISVPIALAGLGCILAGGIVYAYSTRFRADGMGRSKADSDQADDNG